MGKWLGDSKKAAKAKVQEVHERARRNADNARHGREPEVATPIEQAKPKDAATKSRTQALYEHHNRPTLRERLRGK